MPRSTLGSGGDPLIWLGLAAATLFFVASGAVAYLNFQTLKQDSALVVHSGETLTALEDVLSTVKDAETGQRGYLLTGKDSYLDPYSAVLEDAFAQQPQPQRKQRIGQRRQLRQGKGHDHQPGLMTVAQLAQPPHGLERRRQGLKRGIRFS